MATPSSLVTSVGNASKATARATKSFLSNPVTQSWLFYGGLPLLSFIVLSPGMFITIPPAKDCNDNAKFWFSGQTSIISVLLHALIFFGFLVAIFKAGKALNIAHPF
jgi:hypothetical protein